MNESTENKEGIEEVNNTVEKKEAFTERKSKKNTLKRIVLPVIAIAILAIFYFRISTKQVPAQN